MRWSLTNNVPYRPSIFYVPVCTVRERDRSWEYHRTEYNIRGLASGRRRNDCVIMGFAVDRITPTSRVSTLTIRSEPVRMAQQEQRAAPLAPERPEASGNISVDLHYDTNIGTLKRTKGPSHLRVSIVHAQNAAHPASRTRESR